MQKIQKNQAWLLLFLVVGFAAVLEFVFVRGMFTWLPMVVLVIFSGSMNVILAVRNSNWLLAALVFLCTIALCMGYFIIA